MTAVACAGAGLSSMLFSDYDHVPGFEGREHVFSGIQRDARDFVDRNVYGIDPDAVRRKAAAAAAASPRDPGAAAPPPAKP